MLHVGVGADEGVMLLTSTQASRSPGESACRAYSPGQGQSHSTWGNGHAGGGLGGALASPGSDLEQAGISFAGRDPLQTGELHGLIRNIGTAGLALIVAEVLVVHVEEEARPCRPTT